MRRQVAIVVGVAIVAAGIGLLVWSRTNGDDRASGLGPRASGSEPDQTRANKGADPDPEARGPRPEAAVDDVRVVERRSGGVVRDHRREPGAIDPSSTPRVPLENAPVDPHLILALREQLRPIVAACSRDHAADVSDGAQLRQRVGVTIQGEVLRVTELSARSTGISGSAVADCVAEKAKQIELGAEGHEDVRHHMLTFPFRLPAK